MRPIKKKEKPLIVLTAGGTGGHVYPAESLAEELLMRGYRLVLITDKRGKNNYKGKLGEIPNYAVLAGALVGKSKWFKIKSLFKTCIGILQAGYFLLKNQPACVVGFGGYASFPTAMAAILLGKDLIIHEQNSVMSRTNRFLSKYAEVIAQSFKKVKFAPKNKKQVLVGMPVRKAISRLYDEPYPERTAAQKFQLMVLGGSQGAKFFGEVVPQAIAKLPENLQKKMCIYQQCRAADVDDLKKTYEATKAQVIIEHFFGNMDKLYAGTHLIISRAGASSVAEIALAGIPSILIPLPNAADDHQSHNAEEFERVKGGIVLKQKECSVDKLAELLEHALRSPKDLKQMSDKTKMVAQPDAAKHFADEVEKVVYGRR